MKPINNPKYSFNPYLILLGLGIILMIWLFGTNITRTFTLGSLKNWNTIDSDVTTNGNALRAFVLYETKKNNATPKSPLPSSVFNKPSNYYGKYLQLSGTVKAVLPSSPPSRLESLTIGSSSEIVVLANDGRTLIDFFLIGRNQNFSPGAPLTLYGYTSGTRYVPNPQGISSPALVLIGGLQR